MIRSTKKRTLERHGIVHVSGWVYEEDVAKVNNFIARAAPIVERVEEDGKKEGET